MKKSNEITWSSQSDPELQAVDYRTALLEAARLPGETAVDKYIRIAAKLKIKNEAAGEHLDLPNPQFPRKICRLSGEEFSMYEAVFEQLFWLELAAIRTSRKSREIAVARLYKSLEKECGVNKEILTSYIHGLSLGAKSVLPIVAACILRDPMHDPIKPPKYIKSRRHKNVVILRLGRSRAKMSSVDKEKQKAFDFQ